MGMQSGLERLMIPVRRWGERRMKQERPPHELERELAQVVEQSALGLLAVERIEAMAYDLGAFSYERVVRPGLLGCALVLSALQRQTDTSGRWLDAQGIYADLGGSEMSKTSFRRAVRKMKPVLAELIKRRMKQLAEGTDRHELRGRLEAFRDVIIPDGCAFKLASVLSGVHPGTGNPAELKLHAVYSVKTGMASVTPTAGRVHDNDGFWPEWESGALYIWDLGKSVAASATWSPSCARARKSVRTSSARRPTRLPATFFAALATAAAIGISAPFSTTRDEPGRSVSRVRCDDALPP